MIASFVFPQLIQTYQVGPFVCIYLTVYLQCTRRYWVFFFSLVVIWWLWVNSNFWYFEIRSVFITQNNIWYSSNEVSVQMTFMTCYLFRESVNQTDHMEVVYEHMLLRKVDCISWSSQTFLNISEHVARYSFSKWKHSESKEIGFYLDCAMLV